MFCNLYLSISTSLVMYKCNWQITDFNFSSLASCAIYFRHGRWGKGLVDAWFWCNTRAYLGCRWVRFIIVSVILFIFLSNCCSIYLYYSMNDSVTLLVMQVCCWLCILTTIFTIDTFGTNRQGCSFVLLFSFLHFFCFLTVYLLLMKQCYRFWVFGCGLQ